MVEQSNWLQRDSQLARSIVAIDTPPADNICHADSVDGRYPILLPKRRLKPLSGECVDWADHLRAGIPTSRPAVWWVTCRHVPK